MSEEGKAFIKRRESVRLDPHWDAIGQVWDIGYGHVFKGDEPRQSITMEEANALFDVDIHYYSDQVDAAVIVDLTPNMFDALTSLTYNIGGGAFHKSSLLAYLNNKQYLDACVEFLEFRFSRGAYVEGLLKRRAAEAVMYAKGVYLP